MTNVPGTIAVCGFQESGVEWLTTIVSRLIETSVSHNGHQTGNHRTNVTSHVNLGPSACPVDVFLPENKVVLIVRHPKDTAVATFLQGGYQGAWDFCDFLTKFFGETGSLGLSWTDYIVQWNDAVQQLGPGRVHIIYYNHLVNKLWDEAQKLYNYLGLPPSLQQSIEQLVSGCSYHNFFERREPDRKRRKVMHTKQTEFELHEVDLWKKYFTVRQNEDVNRILVKVEETNNAILAHCR